MKVVSIAAIAAISVLSATTAFATNCSEETVAGRWYGGDTFAVCRINFRENGRIAGFCEEEDEFWDGDQFIYTLDTVSVRGVFSVDADCKMDLRIVAIEDDGSRSRVRFQGRLTGAASSRPDIAILSTGTGSRPRINFTMYRD